MTVVTSNCCIAKLACNCGFLDCVFQVCFSRAQFANAWVIAELLVRFEQRKDRFWKACDCGVVQRFNVGMQVLEDLWYSQRCDRPHFELRRDMFAGADDTVDV